MPYDIECRECRQRTWVGNIVNLLKEYIDPLERSGDMFPILRENGDQLIEPTVDVKERARGFDSPSPR